MMQADISEDIIENIEKDMIERVHIKHSTNLFQTF